MNRRWWLTIPVTLTLLALLDLAVRAWHPLEPRLPEHFSTAYLERTFDAYRARAGVVLVAGDSAIWGYHVRADESLGAALARRLQPRPLLNLSVEGGSPANTYVAVTAALERGVRPALVVINLNLKEFSPGDRSYQRILPALEPVARRLPAEQQRDLLYSNDPAPSPGARFVERFWELYRLRTDIRQAIFGDSDLAARAAAVAQELTGRAARERVLDAPTADRYLGTYDLSPIAPDNVSLRYTRLLFERLRRERIPLFAFLTPTNHGLLHDTIDSPPYDDNLRALAREVTAAGGTVVDRDRAFGASAFIDNDHLKPPAIERLASGLAEPIERAAR